MKIISEEKINKYFIIIEAVFFIAGIISIFAFGDSLFLGNFKDFNNDDVKYIRSAWTLLDKHMLCYKDTTHPTMFIMPGLTFALSFFMYIFGKMNGIIAFKIFQVILQCGSLYLIFLIAKKVFNSKAALTACLFDAVYAVEIYSQNLILMEVIFKFLLLLLIYISIYAIEKKSLKLYAGGGIVWGLACLFRPTIAAYPVLILIMWIKNKYSFKEIVKYTVVVSAVFCIVMSPWWVRNYKTFNKVVLFTKSTGNPFLQGTFINYNQSNGYGVPYKMGNGELENNQIEIKIGLDRLKKYGRREPIKYAAWYTLGKTFYFWRAPFYWIANISYIPVIIYHYFILFYALYGIIKCRNKSPNVNFIIMAILYFNLIYLPYYTFERYAYPVMPLMIIFAAYGIPRADDN